MLNENFVYLSFIIAVYADFDYFLDTLKGKVKPNRVTWFLWALAPLIAFAAMVSEGVGLSSLMTFASGFAPLLIVFGTFISKKSYWKLGKFDILCGIISVFALFLWYLTKTGTVAILFSIIADGLAGIPTVIKSYQEPETESAKVYLLNALAIVITLFTIKTWTFTYVAFPVYVLLICMLIAIIILSKQGSRLTKK
jgi:hypothetical protein